MNIAKQLLQNNLIGLTNHKNTNDIYLIGLGYVEVVMQNTIINTDFQNGKRKQLKKVGMSQNKYMKEKRTLKQNNAIHLYCELLAKELNTLGLDMRVVLKKPD